MRRGKCATEKVGPKIVMAAVCDARACGQIESCGSCVVQLHTLVVQFRDSRTRRCFREDMDNKIPVCHARQRTLPMTYNRDEAVPHHPRDVSYL